MDFLSQTNLIPPYLFYVNWKVNSITVEEDSPGCLNSPEPCLSRKAIRNPGALPWLHSYCQACFKELGITSTYLIYLISRMVYRHISFHSAYLIPCVKISEPKHLFLINKIIAILREYKLNSVSHVIKIQNCCFCASITQILKSTANVWHKSSLSALLPCNKTFIL